MDTATPDAHLATASHAAQGNGNKGNLSLEGVSGETHLVAVESLEPEQQTYLGWIRRGRRDPLALKHARVDPPTLARWRLDPLFASLEAVVRAKAGGISKALARDTAEAHAHEHVLSLHALAFNRDPETGERMQSPILSRTRDGVVEVVGHEDAVKPGERIKASTRLLEVAGSIGAQGQAGLNVTAPADATMELYLRVTSGKQQAPGL